MNITIAQGVVLPPDTITQAIAILAKRRVGKSYGMRKMVEQMLTAGHQVVIVDPKGDQWGIRSSADGKEPGFPVLILGGEHGDLPLEANAGETIANLVVKERVSVLLDVSHFRKSEVATFMTGFLENLYRLKAQEKYRTPMMLVIDEADAIAPQKPQKGEERMLGAANDIVRRGGQRGIGCTLVTQRSAVLNKNVLTQCEMLIVLRTIAPQDLAAMKAWIDVHGTEEEGRTLMESLPSLPIGDAWFWSPGWPTEKGIFKRAHILPITTFDSGATPKVGQRKVVPKTVADVDLDALKEQMASTIEKAKQDSPKFLRAEIDRLSRESKSHKCPAQNGVDPKEFERQVKAALEPHIVAFGSVENAYKQKLDEWDAWAKNVQAAFKHFPIPTSKPGVTYAPEKVKAPTYKPMPPPPGTEIVETAGRVKVRGAGEASTPVDQDFKPTGSQQKILDTLAWLERLDLSPANRVRLAFLSDTTPKSSGYINNLGALRSAGMVAYPSSGLIELTEAGRGFATVGDEAYSDDALHYQIRGRVTKSQWAILEVLIASRDTPLVRDVLAERANTTATSSGFINNLGTLRSLGLLDYPSAGKVLATPQLFLR